MSLERALWAEEALGVKSLEGLLYIDRYISHIVRSMPVNTVVLRVEDRPRTGGPGMSLYSPRAVDGYASKRGVA